VFGWGKKGHEGISMKGKKYTRKRTKTGEKKRRGNLRTQGGKKWVPAKLSLNKKKVKGKGNLRKILLVVAGRGGDRGGFGRAWVARKANVGLSDRKRV